METAGGRPAPAADAAAALHRGGTCARPSADSPDRRNRAALESHCNYRPVGVRVDFDADELAAGAPVHGRRAGNAGPKIQPRVDRVWGVYDDGMAGRRRGGGAALPAAAARKEIGMSRFREELKVIPRAVRIIVAFVLFGLSSAFTLFLMFSHDPELIHTPRFGKLLMIVGVGIVPAIWVLLIGYVYADAKRRGMRYVMWTQIG